MVNTHIETYLKHLPAITRALDAQRAAFYFNNPLFIVSRLAVPSSGFQIAELDRGLLLESPGRWRSVLPLTPHPEDFIHAITQAATPGVLILRVPRWAEAHLSLRVFQPMWPDYVGSTAILQEMKGRRFKSMRRRIRSVERTGRARVVRLTAAHAEAAAQVAHDWYRGREDALGTMYLEEENAWMFSNLGWLLENIPGTWGIGVEVDGELHAINLSCVLSESVWCCHTERYRPDVLNGINQLAFREACRAIDAARYPWVNDGSADAPETGGVDNLASFKARLAETRVQPFQAGLW